MRSFPPAKGHQQYTHASPGDPEAHELLAFYKNRVDEFENEREALLRSVERTGMQAADLHRLDWENRKRADEVRELQK
ncbi:hypothetical protein DUNSADRAFT_14636, partial [Dunaliella salina]